MLKRKKQLVICDIRLTQGYLGCVELVLITAEKKMEDAKELSLKKNVTGMGTYQKGTLIMFLHLHRKYVAHVTTLTKTKQ